MSAIKIPIVSSFRDGSDDYDITVPLPEKDRQVKDVLHELLIPAPDGTTVPLSTLAEIDTSLFQRHPVIDYMNTAHFAVTIHNPP